jgi:hypothetical protein
VACAYLKTNELQDLVDQIGEISKAGVGYGFRVQVRLEVGGDGKRPPQEVVAVIIAKLDEGSKDLKIG